MEWKEVNVGSLCLKVCSGGTPKSNRPDYYGGGIPWLNTKEINFNRIYSTESTITQDGLDNSSAKWIEKNSVIVAMYGATAGKVAIAKIPLTTNQACCNLMLNSQIADYNFIFYSLSYNFSQLASLANGGAQQNLNAQIIKEFKIKIPSLDDQKNISSILSSLDDKIENNNKINANLEAQAQALFKSWFVDFEPFQDGEFEDSELGRIPKGWEVGTLESLCSFISRGLSPKYNNDTDQWVLGQTCVRNNIVSMNNARKHILKSQTEKKVKQWDVLINSTGIGSLGRVGIIYFNSDNVAFDSHLTVVRAENPIYKFYIGRNLLNRQLEIENMAVGSTGQTELPRESVKQMRILIPSEEVLSHFNSLLEPIGLLMYGNLDENKSLSTLRDTLLPKLMSGEIEV